MAETSATITQAEPEHPIGQRVQQRFPAWHHLALGGITLISIFMNFFQLGQNGFGSYYPAAVRSMMDNWHNFFFAAYDPGGFVTIDKPPVGFWFEVASAKLFGFSPFSVLVPQALAGVLSAVIVGVGFNIKMLEAYLVVPAFGLLYLLAAHRSIWKRIGHLALAGTLLLVISLSWVVVVDLTPASQRPYVGSTQDNSELSLALGYNGIQRLLGSFGGFGGGSSANRAPNGTPPSGNTGRTGTSSTPGTPPNFGNGGSTNTGGIRAGQQPPSGGSGGGGAGGLFDIGTPGPLRLFTQPLAGQIAWLLPFALLGAVALAWQRRPRLQSDRKQQSLLLWGMWLLTMGIFFSVASFFHQYYFTVMAPAIAALFGIGVVTMWQDYRRGGWRGWLLPIALVATVAEQVYILSQYPTWGQWLIPLLVVLSVIAVGALLIARIAPHFHLKAPGRRVLVPALAAGVLVLMLAPTVWAAVPILTSTQADTLVAGPTQTTSLGGNAGGGQSANASSDAALIRYLEGHQGTAKFLGAVSSSRGADAIILATNKPVMTLGGFSGSDPILTTSQLAALVESGQVKYFLLSGSGGFGAGGSGQSALITWIQQHSKVVPSSQWQSSATSSSSSGFGGAEQLYEYTGA